VTVFWDNHGVIHTDYLEKGKTINGIYYADLVSQTQKKQQKQKNILLWILHNNASIHKCAVAMQEVNDSGLKLFPHPPFSPDIAPSAFYLLQHLKKLLRGKVFDSRDELKCFMSDWFSALLLFLLCRV
jgi:transposase